MPPIGLFKKNNRLPDDFPLTTEKFLPEGAEELEIVAGACSLCTNVVSDFAAKLRNLSIGGEMGSYVKILDKGTKLALRHLAENAHKIGADGVYGIRMASPQISDGAAEVIAVGTAYKIKRGDKNDS